MTDRFDELRAAHAASTLGEWYIHAPRSKYYIKTDGHSTAYQNGFVVESGVRFLDDARFIIAAKRDVPLLLAENARLVELLRQAHIGCGACGYHVEIESILNPKAKESPNAE